ncbi:MAG TPA: hypothetical protein PLV92_06580 [Pirellulaceae bacterium]|nr:hypothetical protein [Pirellulaceae bacterium]
MIVSNWTSGFRIVAADDVVPETSSRELAQRDDDVGFDGMAILTGTPYASITVERELWFVLLEGRTIIARRAIAKQIESMLTAAFPERSDLMGEFIPPPRPFFDLRPPRPFFDLRPPRPFFPAPEAECRTDMWIRYQPQAIALPALSLHDVEAQEPAPSETTTAPSVPPVFAVGYEARLAAIRARGRKRRSP